jgi:hypothetical protein
MNTNPAPTNQSPTPIVASLQIKPVHMFGAAVAFAGLVLGIASVLLPLYKVDVLGITATSIGGWEGFGDTSAWMFGIPSGFLLAAAGMTLIAAGGVLAWDAKQVYSRIAAVVATVVPVAVWGVLVVNFGLILEQIDKQSESSKAASDSLFSFSSGAASTSASDYLHPATGWWVAGVVVWLALAGGIGALYVQLRKRRSGEAKGTTATVPASGLTTATTVEPQVAPTVTRPAAPAPPAPGTSHLPPPPPMAMRAGQF